MKEKVSVVMATFNGSKYIEEQLNSIINQSIKINELIICDDCSSDGTLEILKKYQKKYPGIVHVYINEENKGYVKNFWSAIKKATNEIIVLSDQDDIWDKNKIEIILDSFNCVPDGLAFNFGYRIINEKGKEIKNIKFEYFKNNGKIKKIGFHEFVKSPRYPGMSMAFKKSLYDNICDVDIELITAHDWMINQAASKINKMYFVDKTVSSYRQHGMNAFGVNAMMKKEKIFKRRVFVLKEEILNYSHLITIYGIEDIFLLRIKKVGEKRLKLFETKKILGIIINYIINSKYISLRSFLGDIYALMNI